MIFFHINAIKKNSINFNLLKYYLTCFIKIYFKAVFLIRTWQIWRALHLISFMRRFCMQRRTWGTVGFQKGLCLDGQNAGICQQEILADLLCKLFFAQIKVGRKRGWSQFCYQFQFSINLKYCWRKKQLLIKINVVL